MLGSIVGQTYDYPDRVRIHAYNVYRLSVICATMSEAEVKPERRGAAGRP